MSLNVDLLMETVEWVESEAEKDRDERKWYQASWMRVKRSPGKTWSCGSQACVAGHVVLLAGWKPVIPEVEVADGGYLAVDFVEKDGEERYIEELAAELLGISQYNDLQSLGYNHLFDGMNDAQDIREIAEALIAEHA